MDRGTNSKKRWLALGGLLVLTAAGAGGSWAWKRAGAARSPLATLKQAELKRGDIVVTVTAAGTLKPVNQVEVGAQVSGRVKELFADYNSEVTKGQLLAVIDPALFESAKDQAAAKLESAKADLEKAQGQLDEAQLALDRAVELGKKGYSSDAEVITARTTQRTAATTVSSSKAQVTLAKASLDQAVANLAYCRITAPVSGLVISRSVEVGQTVQANFSTPTLFVIAEDLRHMEVHTNVAESDVGKVVPDQRVEFTVDAWPEQTFSGTVRQVRYAAQTVSNVVTYDAVVRVENEDLKLRPGMTANVSFIVAERRNVLTAPALAFRFHPQPPAGADGPPPGPPPDLEGGAMKGPPGGVWVVREGRPTPVAAQAGLTDGVNTEVTQSELREGAKVIVSDTSLKSAAASSSSSSSSKSQKRGPGGPGGPPPPPGLF